MAEPSSPWWKSPSHVIGVLGLALTLGGITTGVWIGVGQSRDARLYSQLGVLTQLAAEAQPSDRRIISGAIPRLRCASDYHRGDLGQDDELALDESLDVYELMAWTFNNHLAPAKAATLWGPRLLDLRTVAIKLLSRDEVAHDWHELAAYRPTGIRPLANPCA
jgi:hypothetical protein